MRRRYGTLFLFLMLGFALPLLGAAARGVELAQYLAFPPRTLPITHTGFSWVAFSVIAAVVVGFLAPFVVRFANGMRVSTSKTTIRLPMPLWGWLGLVLMIGAWSVAWTRLPFFTAIQPYTFSPIWLGYILFINGVCYRRTGHSIVTDRTGFFLTLFPVSAIVWWYFEFLNRFVHNWHYAGIGTLSAGDYFLQATLPFATVLPAVLGTRDWLASLDWHVAFDDWGALSGVDTRKSAGALLLAGAVGLFGIGAWPELLYPLVWVAPLLLIVALQQLAGGSRLLHGLGCGDWSRLVLAAIAGLVCGFLWEMWNYFSLARWTYTIPYVDRFALFEMPLLGYAGYLPFGVTCLAIARLFVLDADDE